MGSDSEKKSSGASAAESSGRAGFDLDAWRAMSSAERHAVHLARMEARRDGGKELGTRVIDRVARRLDNFRKPVDPIWARRRDVRLPRPADWRGPHAGKMFTDPASLRQATEEECAAGFEATWGYAFTDEDKRTYKMVADTLTDSTRESEARGIYSRLHSAITDATAFAERNYNQGGSPAMIAIGELWGMLALLPPLEELPGYAKTESRRGYIARTWQSMATQGLGRPLEKRELAELSILLGEADPPYGQYLAKHPKRSVAWVIDEQSRRLAKVKLDLT